MFRPWRELGWPRIRFLAIRLTPLLAVPLVLSLYHGINLGMPPPMTVLLAFLLLLLLPGHLLADALFPPRRFDFMERIVVDSALGTVLLSVPIIAGYLLSYVTAVSMDFLFYSYLFILLATFGLSQRLRGRHNQSSEERPPEEKGKLGLLLLVLFSVAVAVVVVGISARYLDWRFDNMGHIAAVRKFVENGTIEPFNACSGAFFSNAPLDYSYGLNTWEPIIAFMTRVSRVQLEQAWVYLTAILASISTFAYYFLARELFKRTNIALVSTMAFLVLQYVVELNNWHGVMLLPIFSLQPRSVALGLLLPAVLAFFLRFLKVGSRGYLVATAMLASVLLYLHASAFVVFFAYAAAHLATVSILHVMGREQAFSRDRAFLAIAAAAVASVASLSVPVKLYITATSGFPAALPPTEPSPNIWLNWNSNFFMVNPGAYFPLDSVGWGHVALLLLPVLLFTTVPRVSKIFIVSSIVWTSFVIFNPLLAPLLSRAINPALVYRLAEFEMRPFILGYFVYVFISWLSGVTKVREPLWLIFLSVLVMVFSAPDMGYFRNIWGVLTNNHRPTMFDEVWLDITKVGEEGFFHFVNGLPPRSVVFTDPVTGLRIPPFSNQYVNVAPCWATIGDGPQRYRDADLVFAPDTPDEVVEGILSTYRSDYLVLTTPHPVLEYRFDLLFPKIYRRDGQVVYAVSPERAGRYEGFLKALFAAGALRNGDFEQWEVGPGAPPGWAAERALISREDQSKKVGAYAARVKAQGAWGRLSYSIPNPAEYAGKTLTLLVWGRAEERNGGQQRVGIKDDQGETVSAAMVKDGRFHIWSATRKIGSSPSWIEVNLFANYSAAEDVQDVAYFDGAVLLIN